MSNLYQRRNLETEENIGEPGPVPAELLGWPDDALADISATAPLYASERGYAGQGFFPVAPLPAPPMPPFVPDELNKIDFARLFTQAERIAIDNAGASNAYVRDYNRLLDMAPPKVRLSDPDLQTGVVLLEFGGLIGVGRAAQILAGQAP